MADLSAAIFLSVVVICATFGMFKCSEYDHEARFKCQEKPGMVYINDRCVAEHK